jgi:hypothetical protein
VLGFRIQYECKEDGFAMLEKQGSRIMLDEIIPDGDTAWIAAQLEAPFGRGINLQIEASDVEVLYAKIQESTFTIFLPLEEKRNDAYVGNKQFIVLDSDGYMLRFYKDLLPWTSKNVIKIQCFQSSTPCSMLAKSLCSLVSGIIGTKKA